MDSMYRFEWIWTANKSSFVRSACLFFTADPLVVVCSNLEVPSPLEIQLFHLEGGVEQVLYGGAVETPWVH